MKLLLQLTIALALLASLATAKKGKGGGVVDFCDCCRFVRRDRARARILSQDDDLDDVIDDIFDVCSATCGCAQSGCFSEEATVQVLQKGVVPMQDLEVGDKVLTANHQYHYEEVYGFGHNHESKKMQFLKISNANPEAAPLESLETTGSTWMVRNIQCVLTPSIEVGDMLRSQQTQLPQ